MLAAIRVRGSVNVSPQIKKTLELLRLDRVNHLVLAEDKQRAMLNKVQSYTTFGEIDAETLASLLEKRGRLAGNKRLEKEFLGENKFKDFDEAAKAVLGGKKLKELGIKPVFRLSPPKKGYERGGIKKGYTVGGALGYRASDISKLIKRMI
jgi:large subunit ribosomal protein L30